MSDRCQGCKMLRMTVWLCIMILNGSVTLSGSPFDCLWHSFLVNLRIWDDWWKLLYQNCNFRNMLLVPRNLSAIFRSRSSLLYTGTTGPCLDEMSPPLKRVYPLMRCLLLDGRVPPWWDVPPPDERLHPDEMATVKLYLRRVDDIIHYPGKGTYHRILCNSR